MKESDFYDPIGKWLVKEKGCQRDGYSRGYIVDRKAGDIRMDVSIKPDVLGIRYEVIKNVYPVIEFHGYIVEVKKNKRGLDQLMGKMMGITDRARTSREWKFGMHTVRFYIAYPTDQIPPEIFSRCKQEGIGILTLPILNEKDLDELRADDVFEALEPKEVKLDGMSHASQKLDGTFLDCINRINYLKQMFPSPEKLYNDFIGTEIKKKRMKINRKKI